MKLPFLDGIRSLAALFVFACHAYMLQFGSLPRQSLADAFLYPHLAVEVFIVLSGFCLGLSSSLKKDYWRFLQRRCRRILPAYYGAVLVSGFIFLALFSYGQSIRWQAALSSLLLLSDLYPDNGRYFSPTFWTTGIEFRLYCLFPLFALIYRKAGSFAVISLAMLTSGCWYALATAIAPSYAQRWSYLGLFFPVLFVFGFIASQSINDRRAKFLSAASFVALAITLSQSLLSVRQGNYAYVQALPLIDLLNGCFTASLLIIMAQASPPPLVVRLLSLPMFTRLAIWSYSLYLMHFPLLRLFNFYLDTANVQGWKAIALETIPVMLCCYLFSVAFEYRFFPDRQDRGAASIIEP